MKHLAAVALLAALILPASAQDDAVSVPPPQDPNASVPDELLGMLGPWNLEQEDPAQPGCPLNFTATQVSGGWIVEVPDPCPAPYPGSASLAVWNVDAEDGSVLLLDSAGTVTLRLFEDEDGLYDTGPDRPPRYYLLPPYDADGSGGEADVE
jgi:hypothetical protein